MSEDLSSLDPLHTPLTRQRLLVAGGAVAALLPLARPLSASAAPRRVAAKPKRGGTLKASYSDQLANIGTADWGLTGYSIGFTVFNRLLRQVPGGRLEPELLRAMPSVSKDGRHYTFELKKGVKFHNGAEVTADDVKFSIERAIDPKSGQEAQGVYGALGITGTGPFTKGKAKEIVGLKSTDRYTLTMQLDAPNSAVLGALSLPMASVVPKAYVQRIGNDAFEHKSPIGTGPYKIVSYKPGQRLDFERFTDYFDPARGGYVDRIEFSLNVDPQLALLRIESGQQDLMQNPIPAGSLAQLRGDPRYKQNIGSGYVNNTFFAALSDKHPAMKDPRVRQAIAYAVDKEKAVRQLGGVDRPANGGIFTPLSPYYQSGMGYPYDPEKAKALLAKAGYAKGFDVTVLSQQPEPHLTLNQSLTADLNAVGIRAKSTPLPQGKFSAEVLKFKPVIVVNQWELAYPHGSYIIDSTFTSQAKAAGCCNFSWWSTPRSTSSPRRAGRPSRSRSR